jgi:hypothetical protein
MHRLCRGGLLSINTGCRNGINSIERLRTCENEKLIPIHKMDGGTSISLFRPQRHTSVGVDGHSACHVYSL